MAAQNTKTPPRQRTAFEFNPKVQYWMTSAVTEPGWQHGPCEYKPSARELVLLSLPTLWPGICVAGAPQGSSPRTGTPCSMWALKGEWTLDFYRHPKGTALRLHRKGTGVWGQDTGWVRQQNTDRRSLEHISTPPPHGWGCLPQTLTLTCWCHYEQHIKKGTGFPKKERGGKKNRCLKCLAAAEAGEALRRARCLVQPWWERGQWESCKHIPSP